MKLCEATASEEILEVLARRCWHLDHDRAECPLDKLVTVQGVAEQLTETPESVGDWQHDLNRGLNETMQLVRERGSETLQPPRRWWWTWVETSLQDPRPKLIAVGVGPRLDTETVRERRLDEAQEWSEYPPLLLSVEEVHATWCDLPESRPPHPLEKLVRAWQKAQRRKGKSPEERHLILIEERRRPPDDPLLLTRAPGLLSLVTRPLENANLASIKVDGEPLATAAPRVKRVGYRLRRHQAVQGGLAFAPKMLSGQRIEDMLIATLAEYPLTGDERSPLRSDIHFIALLAYALTGPTHFNERIGALILTGGVTPGGIQRWWDATAVARAMTFIIDSRTREWRELVYASTPGEDKIVDIGPPEWWKGKGRMNAWRLSGGLWRPARLGGPVTQGTTAGYWGGLHRTINGLESALSWGRSAGRGRDGRIPDNLRPKSKGGPGPEVFVPWQMVLMLASEHIPPDTGLHSAAGQRYRERVKALEAAGYLVPSGRRAAPAGDTVEIVRVVPGHRWQVAGIVIRASARFCAAVESAQSGHEWTRVSVTRLIERNALE